VWYEVDGIIFRQCFVGIASSIRKHRCLESRFKRQGDRAFDSAPTETVKREPVVVDVGASLEVVKGAPQVLGSLDGLIALLV
jgi:hypothetical protein